MSELDPAKTALSRAISSCAAISASRLFGRRHKLFGTRQWWFLGREYETLWPFADAWSALCTFGSLPDQHQALMLLDAMTSGLRFYSNERDILESTGDAGFESVVTPPLGSGGDRFYDDNAWLGLALVSHHELSGNPALLRLAQRVFGFVVSGWSTDPTWHVPGGIRWKEPTEQPLPQYLRERTGS
jgi:hypothetical protein